MGYLQKHVVIKDRVNIYKDFTLNLLFYIDKYYLDRNTLNNDIDIYNHYKFCYNKTCEDFLKEEIDFTKNNELIEYFYVYYYTLIYDANSKHKFDLISQIKFWNNVFNNIITYNAKTIDIFIETYRVFDKSINAKKNILELI